MTSNDHAQSDGLGPATNTSNSISVAPSSSQPVSSSTLELRDNAINASPTNAPQEQSTSAADNVDNVMAAPSQQSDAEAITTTTIAPETEEQKVATSASGLPSDASIKEPEDPGPSLTIVLLLITGTRYPIKIDKDFLRKRDVSVDNYDPFAMSVYTLKELIWRSWQEDWEPRPSSPSSIRLISFGKLLDDKSPLSDSKFSCDAPNVVHMTVKPQEIVDEEDAKGAKTQYSRDREASERSPRCRCVIQ
ncbi:ubiquitin-related domain-containing protein [Aspergillus cavernicola]|uniref:Ubiquitin-related domain-containing protein n=1 Tax=Aspergillus cavernicola TaxID=176166 RepID=A0ABR4HYB1_9EURO